MTLSQVPRELAERLGLSTTKTNQVEAVIREAMQKAQLQWISVEEKLPEEWRYVLICRWDGAPRNGVGFIVWVGRYFGNTGWQSDDGVEIQCPTHWMPLPEPPNSAASLTHRAGDHQVSCHGTLLESCRASTGYLPEIRNPVPCQCRGPHRFGTDGYCLKCRSWAEDGKFGFKDGKIVNLVSGQEIPEDEPLFLLRARDHHAYDTLMHYLMLSESDCNDLHQEGIKQVIQGG